jgi:glycosyltransferase involved in cell wall biosynthesis
MKILHVTEYAEGGVATYLNQILNEQSNCPEIKEVKVIVSDSSSSNLNINSSQLLTYNYKRKFRYFLKTIYTFNKFIKQTNPDIIHIHSTYAGFFIRIIYFLKKKEHKIVYCSHGWSFLMDTATLKQKIYLLIEKILSIKTDAIINISKYEFIKSVEKGIDKNKSYLIYNGISKQIKLERIDLHLDDEYINLLFIGRFDKQKGLDILLDVINKYQKELSKIRLYLIGKEILNNKKISIPDNVIQLGWINNRLLDSYYSKFDVVIAPSRWEGFGLVVIEAMKNKKAVIVSNKGALPELVQDGENGYVFTLEDENQLFKILSNLERKKLQELGINGEKRFLQSFTSEQLNNNLIKLYKKLYNKR